MSEHSRTVLQYLNTFRHVPGPVMLDLATREFQMSGPQVCIAGWAFRAGLSQLNGSTYGHRTPDEITECVDLRWLSQHYGGSYNDWNAIFLGVCETGDPGEENLLARIELAFTLRIEELVSRRKRFSDEFVDSLALQAANA